MLRAVALHEANHLALDPACDPFAGGIIPAMQDVRIGHIDPPSRRVRPAGKFAADICLKVVAESPVFDRSAVGEIAAGLVGGHAPPADAAEPRARVCT